LIRWLGLWRLVVGRVRSDLPFLFALWLLVVSAITLLAAGSLYAQTVDSGGLRRALAEAAPDARGVLVGVTASPAEVEQLDPSIRTRLTNAFGAGRAEVVRAVRSSALLPVGQPSGNEPVPLVVLGAYESLVDHVELVEGEWPVAGQQPVLATLSEGAAAALGMSLGDRLVLADASTPGADASDALAEVELSGIYRVDVNDDYWLGDVMEREGVGQRGSARVAGPLMVDLADITANQRLARLDVDWRALPRVDQLSVADLPRLRARIGGLATTIEGDLGDDRFVTVNAALAQVLAGIDRAALASRSGVVLITLQFAALAGCAVLLVGGILAERRRAEVALLRARGASTAEIGLLAAGEASLLTLPAALLAPLIALVLVGGIGGWGAIGESGIIGSAQLDEATWLVTLAAAVACIAALTLPALAAELDLARVRAALGRPLTQSAAQRLGLDLVLLALAVLGLIQLRSYGATLTRSADASLQLDPLLVAAPAIALVAGAILVVRLIPRLGQAAEWLLRRRSTMVPPYGARRAARRPLRLARWALLIVLAAALGTFGALYTETWTRSQVEQAAYQAGADLRVTRPQHAATRADQMTRELTALSGVTAVSPATRAQLEVGRAVRQAVVLAVEPESLAVVADLPRGSRDELAAAIEQLATERPLAAALELPTEARRLAVVLDVDLAAASGRPDFDFEIDDWPGISITPVVDLGGSELIRLPSATALMQGEQHIAFELPPADDPAGTGARLVALELTAGAPVEATGEIRLLEIMASAAADGDAWQPVADARAMGDWSFVFHRSPVQQPGTFPGGAPTHNYAGPTIDFPSHAPLPMCASWSTAEPGCQYQFADIYRWSARSADQPLPAIAGEAFLAAAGASVGDIVTADWFGKVDLRIVDSVAEFPSLDPARPFVLVDRASLNRLRAARQLESIEPSEWWLSAADNAVPAITTAALLPPIAAGEVVSRTELTRTLQRDPIALGMVGSLLLGSLAAAVFAALALLVGAVVSAREQTGELALLRAVGLSATQALRLLSLESAFLLILGLVTGALVGGVIGALVLPTAPLNRTGTQVVPAPEVVFPWELAGAVAVGALALIVLVTLISWREIHRQQVVDVLRESAD
jgi:hypothetical protein